MIFIINLKIFSKRVFNVANLVLITLVLLILWNSWLATDLKAAENIAKQAPREIEFRVLQPQKNQFNRLSYNVWSNNGVYNLYSPKMLDVGKQYYAKAIVENYNTNTKSDMYQLSLGAVGEINLKTLITVDKNCDLVCEFLVKTWNLKRYVQSSFFVAFCGEYKSVIAFALPNGNCKEVNALAVGLVLGGSQEFSQSLKTDFRKLGLTHLVAVSGFQVVLVVSFVEFLLLRLNMRRSLRLALSILFVVFLIVLVGPQPPVIRSGSSILLSMGVLFLSGRRINSLRSLIYSLGLMLLVNPFYIYSLSFQLSALATLGLINAPKISLKNIEGLWAKISSEIINIFVLTLFTFLFTLPIIVNLNGFVSPLSILANLLILPFITLITVLNIFGLIPLIGGLFLGLNSVLQSLLLFLIKDLAAVAPSFNLEKFGNLEMIIYFVVLLVLSQVVRASNSRSKNSAKTAEHNLEVVY
jgi:ComEC/Rec2-related protein